MTHFLRPGVPWDSPAKFLGEQLGASPPANESAFWNHWETAVLGQILARSHLEKYFGNLAPFNQLLKLPSGIIGNGPLWAKSRREAFFGAKCTSFDTFQEAIKICFWKPWDRTVLGQILARSLFGARIWLLWTPCATLKSPKSSSQNTRPKTRCAVL